MLKLESINIWKDVIAKFKNRPDVQNGSILGFKGNKDYSLPEDEPFSIADGLGTTGWCVSASEALTEDDYFQLIANITNTKYRLVSIDIKEMYYGYCYNGSQNKWHTAILMSQQYQNEPTPTHFIIDITCRQFGNDFIDKDVWDLKTWVNTLRSPLCKHLIPEIDGETNNLPNITDNRSTNVKELDNYILNYSLKDHTTLDDNQRNTILNFHNNFVHINNTILLNTISQNEFSLIQEFDNILGNMFVEKVQEGYCVLEFKNRDVCKKWLEILIRNSGKLPQYLYVSKSIMDSCESSNIVYNELFTKSNLNVEENKTFLVIKFNNVDLIEFNLPNITNIAYFNQKFTVKSSSIYDFGIKSTGDKTKKSNTIFLELY